MKSPQNTSKRKSSIPVKAVKITILITLGILVAFPLFSMSYYTMVRTSTPEFCATCHEIKPAVRA